MNMKQCIIRCFCKKYVFFFFALLVAQAQKQTIVGKIKNEEIRILKQRKNKIKKQPRIFLPPTPIKKNKTSITIISHPLTDECFDLLVFPTPIKKIKIKPKKRYAHHIRMGGGYKMDVTDFFYQLIQKDRLKMSVGHTTEKRRSEKKKHWHHYVQLHTDYYVPQSVVSQLCCYYEVHPLQKQMHFFQSNGYIHNYHQNIDRHYRINLSGYFLHKSFWNVQGYTGKFHIKYVLPFNPFIFFHWQTKINYQQSVYSLINFPQKGYYIHGIPKVYIPLAPYMEWCIGSRIVITNDPLVWPFFPIIRCQMHFFQKKLQPYFSIQNKPKRFPLNLLGEYQFLLPSTPVLKNEYQAFVLCAGAKFFYHSSFDQHIYGAYTVAKNRWVMKKKKITYDDIRHVCLGYALMYRYKKKMMVQAIYQYHLYPSMIANDTPARFFFQSKLYYQLYKKIFLAYTFRVSEKSSVFDLMAIPKDTVVPNILPHHLDIHYHFVPDFSLFFTYQYKPSITAWDTYTHACCVGLMYRWGGIRHFS